MIFMIFSPGRTGIEPSEPGSLGFFDLPMALEIVFERNPDLVFNLRFVGASSSGDLGWGLIWVKIQSLLR
jgi:hypothetical protein